jgi:hypothetical protein
LWGAVFVRHVAALLIKMRAVATRRWLYDLPRDGRSDLCAQWWQSLPSVGTIR